MASFTTIEHPQTVEAPVLITVAEAERICSIPPKSGYPLCREGGAWHPFVVKAGERIRINRAKLLQWANGR